MLWTSRQTDRSLQGATEILLFNILMIYAISQAETVQYLQIQSNVKGDGALTRKIIILKGCHISLLILEKSNKEKYILKYSQIDIKLYVFSKYNILVYITTFQMQCCGSTNSTNWVHGKIPHTCFQKSITNNYTHYTIHNQVSGTIKRIFDKLVMLIKQNFQIVKDKFNTLYNDT